MLMSWLMMILGETSPCEQLHTCENISLKVFLD